MAIITLTSDMGIRDYYVAAVKGYILSEIADGQIIDISHEISPFNITQAAFVLKNVYRDFPKGTIHIISINPEQIVPSGQNHLVVLFEGHYFIGADNGMFSLLFDRTPDEIYELTFSQDSDDLTFPTKHIFAKAACHLARGGTPQVIGRQIESVRQAILYQPTIEENALVGVVIYIDSYGNVITNITKSLFQQTGKGRPFEIQIRGNNYGITEICKQYSDVAEGNALALFTSSGYLEIAINKGVEGKGGGASSLFGLSLNASVRVEFERTPTSLSDF